MQDPRTGGKNEQLLLGTRGIWHLSPWSHGPVHVNHLVFSFVSVEEDLRIYRQRERHAQPGSFQPKDLPHKLPFCITRTQKMLQW